MPRQAPTGCVNSSNGDRDTKAKQWAKVAERREARDLDDCQASIKILKDKIDAIKSAGLSEDKYDASAELKSLKVELKDEQKKVSRVEVQLAEAVASREQLQQQLDAINEKLARLPSPESAKPSKSNSNGTELTDSEKTEISKLEKQIKEQTDALAEAEKRCGALHLQIVDKNKELDLLTSEIVKYEKRKVEWEKDLKTLRDGKDGHAKQMEKLNKELEQEQKKLDQLLKLEAQAEAGKKELKELQGELRPLQDRLTELKATHQKLTDEADAQNSLVVKARADLKIYRSKHSQLILLEKDLNKLVEADKKLIEENAELKSKLDKEKVEHSSAKAELSKVKNRMSASQKQLDELERTIAELEKTKRERQADERAVEEQVAALLPDLKQSHARIKALQTEYDRVNGLCTSLEKSNAELRKQAEAQGNVAVELEQSRAKVDTLLGQLNDINSQRTEQDTELDVLRKEEARLKESRAKTDRLREELDGRAGGAAKAGGFLPGWTRSIWGQEGKAPSPSPGEAENESELEAIERETEGWKAKAKELEKTLAELTKLRDENAQQSRPGSSNGAGGHSTRTPSSVVSEGFDDSAGGVSSAYVPDERTQMLLGRMKDTIAGLKNKIHELQAEENKLRAENTSLLMDLAGA